MSLRAQPPRRLGVPVGAVPAAQLARDWPDGATGSCPTCSRQPDKLGQDLPSPTAQHGAHAMGHRKDTSPLGLLWARMATHTVLVSWHVRLSPAA